MKYYILWESFLPVCKSIRCSIDPLIVSRWLPVQTNPCIRMPHLKHHSFKQRWKKKSKTNSTYCHFISYHLVSFILVVKPRTLRKEKVITSPKNPMGRRCRIISLHIITPDYWALNHSLNHLSSLGSIQPVPPNM